jgi:hypothetical protein
VRDRAESSLILLLDENLSGQKLYFVIVDSYLYIVPYVIEKEIIFLKTIIPGRKATKMYKEERENLK